MTVDPVRDGTNWYLYVSGDPVNLWDPLGLCEVDPTNWWNIMKVTDPMMRGSDVEELQYCLNQLGYNISVDGYYGNETANAVKQYQASKGLAADGIVGPNTRDEIMKDLGIEVKRPDGWVMPVDDPVIRSGAGEFKAIRLTGWHKGVDLLGNVGDPVKAAKSGKVVVASEVGDYGNVVYIDHDDRLSTRYAHLERIDVRVGDIIETGQQIGIMGRTGNVTTEPTHLHFEVRKIKEGASSSVRNEDTDVLNPNKILPIDSLPKK